MAAAYPERVERALEACLASEDPLDAADLDVVAFVNERFPDENSFAGLDPFLAQLQAQIGELDTRIFDAVKAQSTQAARATGEIKEAKQSIRQLQNKVQDIKGKAQQSEVMVQEICRDIKKLDNAKRHLTYTITSLKRFHMLVTAVDQLEFMVENRQYQETANLLEAVSQLLAHFEEHKSQPTVLKLRDSVARMRTFLTDQIFRDFEALSEVSADYALMSEAEQRQGRGGQGAGAAPSASAAAAPAAPSSSSSSKSLFLNDEDQYSPGQGHAQHTYDDPIGASSSMFYSSDSQTPESLAGACAVVDALGSKVRCKLVNKVCEIWLKPYDALFGPGAEHSGLEAADRRFAWLRRLLRDNEERYDTIFPAEWCINKHVTVAFAAKTEAHLKAELRKIDPPDSADVSALVRALRKTLDFEHEMAVRFEAERNAPPEPAPESDAEGPSGADAESGSATSPTQQTLVDEHGEPIDPMSARGIRMRRELKAKNAQAEAQKLKKREAEAEKADKHRGVDLRASRNEALKAARDLPSVRGVVSTVFEPYLSAYVKLEAEKMREELDEVVKGESVQEEGAMHLTSASNMFLQIRKSINRCIQFTTGQAFYDLYVEFKKVLGSYSVTLEGKLPKTVKPLTPETTTVLCFVCNSAEYCSDTIPQLEELIQSKINEAYREAVDMDDVVDKFNANLMNAIRALVSGVHAAVDPDLVAMAKTNWSAVQQVGDHSAYVSALTATLREAGPRVREQLASVTYFRKFCDMTALSFIARLRETILRCKKLGEMGSQQLLLDVQAVKGVLLGLPTLGDADAKAEDAALAVYTKQVSKELHHLEALLKLVGLNTEPDMVIDNFQMLLPEGTMEDLKMVATLKGLKKADHASVLRAGEEAGLPKGSAATSLSNLAFPPPDAASADGAPASGTGPSFSNVFSNLKMSDMREHLDKVASSTTSGAKGFSSLSASFQQSYNRAVKKKQEK